MKRKANTKRKNHEIQNNNKMLSSTKKLIDKKLNKSFIEIFQVEKIKDITTTLNYQTQFFFSNFM